MIVTSGNSVHTALQAARGLQTEGLDVGVVDLYRIKPLNAPLLIESLGKVPAVLTLEDNMMTGGIGGMVGAVLCENGVRLAFKRLAIGDQHCFRYGDREWMYAAYGLDPRQSKRNTESLWPSASHNLRQAEYADSSERRKWSKNLPLTTTCRHALELNSPIGLPQKFLARNS